jgi:AraC-like DNA-binding protein
MISGCIDRMRQDGCAGCERRDACASLLHRFGIGAPFRKPGGSPEEGRAAARKNPFFVFVAEIAKAVEAATRPKKSAFRREVESAVEKLLASGEVTMDRVAGELGHSRQTLYRRLKAEGATFEQLLAELRRRLALRFVRDQGLSVKETAYRLGFSDPAAFSRAFKRWTGSSPRAMRR